MKNLAVFGGRGRDTNRRTLEDGFVSALASHGVRATASYVILPPRPEPPQGDPGAIRTVLQQRAFGGAYWGSGAPVYAETDQFVKFETTLWNASSGTMVWSGMSQTENPTSSHDFVSSLTGKIVPSLAEAGLIPAKQKAPVSRR